MRAALVALGASATLFGCGGDSPGTTPKADLVDAAPAEDAGVVEEDGKRSPTGCLLTSTGFVTATRAESIAPPGTQNAVHWVDVDNARVDDGAFATITLAEGQESSRLRLSGFRLDVPHTGETWGIEVELKRRAPDGGIEDERVDVEIEGKPTRYKFLRGPWPTSIVGTHAYGQAVDTWGVDLYPADVNSPTFAAVLTVRRSETASGPVTAQVDSLKVAVHYCPDPAH